MIQNEGLSAPARMTEASMSPQLKKKFSIYFFSCLGSELWHAGSSLHHAGSFVGVRGPCGYAMGAPGAPQSCLLPAPCTQCSCPMRHLPPHSGTFPQAAPSVSTIWLTPLCSSKFRLGVTSSKKLFLAFISLTSPYLLLSSWSPSTLSNKPFHSQSLSSFLPCPLCWTVGFNPGHGSCIFKSPGLMTLLHTERT